MATLCSDPRVPPWSILAALAAVVLGATRVAAQHVTVWAGLVPSTGSPSVALEDARIATVRLEVATRWPRTAVELEVFGVQGRPTTALNGDVAVGGGTRRTGGILVGVQQSLRADAAGPYARLSGGLASQTGQSGGRAVGRAALGVALRRWPAFLEAGGIITTCTTAYRSEKTCVYVPVLVGWRF